MAEIGVLEARNNLSALIKQALAGEDVVITSRRIPQVRLVPVGTASEVGSAAAFLSVIRSLPGHQADDASLDRRIVEERDSWD